MSQTCDITIKALPRPVRNQFKRQSVLSKKQNEIVRRPLCHLGGCCGPALLCCKLANSITWLYFQNKICNFLQPGTTVVTKTVTTTTTSAAGAGGDFSLIKSAWELARKNGNIAPKFLFR
jgi:hypothetical protein